MRSALSATRIVLVFLVLLLAPARAMAQTSDAPAPPPAAVHEVWYGEQTLLVDGACIAVGLGAGFAASPATGGTLFLGGYTLGGPTVHLAHHEGWRALESLGLRLGAPVAGAIVGSLIGLGVGSQQTAPRDSDFASPGAYGFVVGGLLGAGVGGLAAVVVDSAALAHTTVPDAPPQGGTVSWAPAITRLQGGGVTIGVSGTF